MRRLSTTSPPGLIKYVAGKIAGDSMPHTSLGWEVIDGISTPNLNIKGFKYSGSRRSKLYANTSMSGFD